MNNFYVYAFLDPRKPGEYVYEEYRFNYEPFYIGKSKYERRTKIHILEADRNKGCNKYKTNKIRSIKKQLLDPVIIKVKENMNEDDAFELEKELIYLIGRSVLKKGPLTNLTDGGEGTSGHTFVMKEETKKRMSKSHKGKKHSDETKKKISELKKGKNHPFYGKRYSDEERKKLSESHKNISDTTKQKMSESAKGKKHSEETKKKISQAHQGRIRSEETRKRISELAKGNQRCLGRKCLEETKRKISESNKGKQLGKNNPFYGKKHTKEAKNKISIAKMGVNHTEETRKKMSNLRMGSGNSFYGKNHSDETKAKISKANKGRCYSEETIKKMSDIKKGKSLSEETRKKISEAGKKYWAKNKQKRLSSNKKKIDKQK